MRSAFKRAALAGLVVGILYAIVRAVRARVPASTSDLRWERAPFPFPPVPRPGPVATTSTTEATSPAEATGPSADAAEAWVEPVDGQCPASHPVKAKLSSGIFHVPGGQNYERTHPDRCYVDADTAAADGLRRSQR